MNFNITLTEEEVNHVLGALQELPAKVANPLSKKIFEQAQEQLPKQEQPAQ